jgi:hypothetical protein
MYVSLRSRSVSQRKEVDDIARPCQPCSPPPGSKNKPAWVGIPADAAQTSSIQSICPLWTVLARWSQMLRSGSATYEAEDYEKLPLHCVGLCTSASPPHQVPCLLLSQLPISRSVHRHPTSRGLTLLLILLTVSVSLKSQRITLWQPRIP